MSNTQNTAPKVPTLAIDRSALPKAVKAFVLAEKGEESAITRANATLAKALEKAAQTKLDGICAAALLLGDVNVSAGQFDAQIADAARKAITASGVKDVTSALNRFKLIVLAMLCGDATLRPFGGEGMVQFLDRVRPLLEAAKLPDGRDVWERKADGSIAGKRGVKTATEEEKAAKAAEKAETEKATKEFKEALGSAGNVTEGGQRRSPQLAAAIILFGDNANARRIETIATAYRDEFAIWARELLEEEETEDERNALAAAMSAAASAARKK